jgi:hypothetical protein
MMGDFMEQDASHLPAKRLRAPSIESPSGPRKSVILSGSTALYELPRLVSGTP